MHTRHGGPLGGGAWLAAALNRLAV